MCCHFYFLFFILVAVWATSSCYGWMSRWSLMQLVLLGDSGVGKSCIVLRFVRGQFDPTSKVNLIKNQLIGLHSSWIDCNFYWLNVLSPIDERVVGLFKTCYAEATLFFLIVPLMFQVGSQVTVGASFLSQTIALQDSTTVKFEIWDTAGQER